MLLLPVFLLDSKFISKGLKIFIGLMVISWNISSSVLILSEQHLQFISHIIGCAKEKFSEKYIVGLQCRRTCLLLLKLITNN